MPPLTLSHFSFSFSCSFSHSLIQCSDHHHHHRPVSVLCSISISSSFAYSLAAAAASEIGAQNGPNSTAAVAATRAHKSSHRLYRRVAMFTQWYLPVFDRLHCLSFFLSPLCQETMACLGAMATAAAAVVTRHCPLLLCNGLPLPLCCTCTHTSTLYIFPVRVAPNTAPASAQCVWRQAYHALLSGAGGGSISSSPSDSETFSSHIKLVLLCTSCRI